MTEPTNGLPIITLNLSMPSQVNANSYTSAQITLSGGIIISGGGGWIQRCTGSPCSLTGPLSGGGWTTVKTFTVVSTSFVVYSIPTGTAGNDVKFRAVAQVFRNLYDDDIVDIVNPPPDTTPPTVSITSPTNGATISGVFTVSVSATDNKGVSRVEFFIDNVYKGQDTSNPYSYNWDTNSYSQGSHSVKAVAYDSSGNHGEDTHTVTVDNSKPFYLTIEVYDSAYTNDGSYSKREITPNLIQIRNDGSLVDSETSFSDNTYSYTHYEVSNYETFNIYVEYDDPFNYYESRDGSTSVSLYAYQSVTIEIIIYADKIDYDLYWTGQMTSEDISHDYEYPITHEMSIWGNALYQSSIGNYDNWGYFGECMRDYRVTMSVQLEQVVFSNNGEYFEAEFRISSTYLFNWDDSLYGGTRDCTTRWPGDMHAPYNEYYGVVVDIGQHTNYNDYNFHWYTGSNDLQSSVERMIPDESYSDPLTSGRVSETLGAVSYSLAVFSLFAGLFVTVPTIIGVIGVLAATGSLMYSQDNFGAIVDNSDTNSRYASVKWYTDLDENLLYEPSVFIDENGYQVSGTPYFGIFTYYAQYRALTDGTDHTLYFWVVSKNTLAANEYYGGPLSVTINNAIYT